MKTFVSSQFNYCPLIWINHSRTLNNKINRIHERLLRVVYNDKKATFDELLDKEKVVNIQTRNFHGTETVSLLGPKLWIILPDKYKSSTNLKEFKSKIKNWVLKLLMSFMQDIHTKCWLYLISIRNRVFTLFFFN